MSLKSALRSKFKISFPEEDSDYLIYNYAKNHIPEDQLISFVSIEYNFSTCSLESLIQDPAMTSTPKSANKNKWIPLFSDHCGHYVATDNPFHPNLTQECASPIFIMHSKDTNRYFHNDQFIATQATILDDILIAAIENNATDIHLNNGPKTITIKQRINGHLKICDTLANTSQSTLLNLIKHHSHMDISLSTSPQDGKIQYTHKHQPFDIRVASMPTQYGEDFSFRLFNSNDKPLAIQDIGFSTKQLHTTQQLLKNPNGLIIITGPTGSGKTTTLYAALQHLIDTQNSHIITVENPIERQLKGIRQSETNAAANHTFTTGLKAILRQDPDCIMLGEIRDAQTAKLALDAAHTGHLVLTSMHTSNIQSTLHRLLSFGCDPFLISNALKGIISQELKADPCPKCQTSLKAGCISCHYTGFSKRQCKANILEVTHPLTISSYADIDPFISANTIVSPK